MENSALNGIVDVVAARYFDGKTKAQPSPNGDTKIKNEINKEKKD